MVSDLKTLNEVQLKPQSISNTSLATGADLSPGSIALYGCVLSVINITKCSTCDLPGSEGPPVNPATYN